ncbi:MAG: DUF1552 domain-containing protein [Myxococcales bacterium]|nr:DUF1552 domain-containing protein [Myxococcales bacterium]
MTRRKLPRELSLPRRMLPRELVMPRRTLLRSMLGGTAIAFGLPLLETMLDAHGTALADGHALPRRLITWMWGNGCRLEHWVPKLTGPDYALTPELAPLEKVKDQFTVLSGFQNRIAGRRGHHDGMAALWSGHAFIELDAMGAPYASKFGGMSIDQRAADLMSTDTLFKSLEFGVTKRHLTNQGPTLETMAHRGPDQPLFAERDPQKVYDKLFASFMPPPDNGDPEGALRYRALDAVLADLHRLEKRVGASDRARLQLHAESVFELEQQLLVIPPSCAVIPKPGKLDFNADGSEPLAEIHSAMSKLMVLAFSCDLSRVASCMFTAPSGGQQFPSLTPSKFPAFPGANDYSHADHHNVSHVNADYEQAFIHESVVSCMQNFSVLLELLAATPDGVGSLLDQTCVLAGSDVTEGWSHSENDYPILIAGGAGGRLRQGVGHYRSPNSESLSDIGLAVLRAVVPDPTLVQSYGSDSGNYQGYTTTPCAAILV